MTYTEARTLVAERGINVRRASWPEGMVMRWDPRHCAVVITQDGRHHPNHNADTYAATDWTRA